MVITMDVTLRELLRQVLRENTSGLSFAELADKVVTEHQDLVTEWMLSHAVQVVTSELRSLNISFRQSSRLVRQITDDGVEEVESNETIWESVFDSANGEKKKTWQLTKEDVALIKIDYRDRKQYNWMREQFWAYVEKNLPKGKTVGDKWNKDEFVDRYNGAVAGEK